MRVGWPARALLVKDPGGDRYRVRRSPFVIAASAAGLAAVLTFRTPNSSSVALGSAGPPARSSGPATTPTSQPPGPATTPTTRSSGPATTPTSQPPVPSTTGGTVSGSAVGPVEQYGYGQLSVRVTIVNGRITALDTATLQTAESYSQQLATQVIPMLRSEILKAQSLQVNAISGATYTSEAYGTSVQAALAKLHFK